MLSFGFTKTSARILVFLCTGLLFVSCDSSSRRTPASVSKVINPSSIQGITIAPDLGGTLVSFTIISPDSHTMSIRAEISEDRGNTYLPAVLDGTRATEGLPATPAGMQHEIVVLPVASLTNPHQSDLRIRVTPIDDINGTDGLSSQSQVFGFGSGTAPQVLAVTTPSGIQGGDIPISYTVADAEEDHVGIVAEYSINNGASWNVASTTEDGDGAEAVGTTTTGVVRTVYWSAQSDLPNVTSNDVRVRLTPVDLEAGTSAESGDFSVNLHAPTISTLTIGSIPADMNGSEPYSTPSGEVEFDLGVARIGSVIRLGYSAHPSGSPVDTDSLVITVDQSVGDDIEAGTNLATLFEVGNFEAVGEILEAYELPLGELTIEATIRDQYGNVSASKTLTVKAVSTTWIELPFTAVDKWRLNFDQDYYTISATGTTTKTVTATQLSNGVADYVEDLLLVGLNTEDPTTDCELLGTNDIMLDYLKDETVGRVRELYGGDFDGDEDGHQPLLQFTHESGGQTSTIRIGGADSGSGLAIGRASFDYRNSVYNSNTGTVLGVFTTNLIEYYINSSFAFKGSFDKFIPGRGTPVGEGEHDHIVLDPDFDRFDSDNLGAENRRYDEIWQGIEAFGRAAAAVATHEIGHSIGLVANGAPPTGLFGGMTEPSFAGFYTTAYHLDTPGPNIMAAAISFTTSVSPTAGYRFNEINEAYLRQWIVLSN